MKSINLRNRFEQKKTNNTSETTSLLIKIKNLPTMTYILVVLGKGTGIIP